MLVTIFERPDGRQNLIEIANVYPEDATWFETNSVEVSMEEIHEGRYAIYGDIGMRADDGTPIEIIYLTKTGETCQDALRELRTMCENAQSSR